MNKLAILNSLHEQTDYSFIHHSQKRLNIITESNFVITKHKPIKNPWDECSYSQCKKSQDLKLNRAKFPTLTKKPNKKPSNHNKSLIQFPKIQGKSTIKKRKNSISGWI